MEQETTSVLEPSGEKIQFDYEREQTKPAFLKHYNYINEDKDKDSGAQFFTRELRASAHIDTPMGRLNIPMGEPIYLLIRKEKDKDEYRLGLRRGDKTDVSNPFPEQEFAHKLEEFEVRLNRGF